MLLFNSEHNLQYIIIIINSHGHSQSGFKKNVIVLMQVKVKNVAILGSMVPS